MEGTGQDKPGMNIRPRVFVPSAAVIIAFVVLGASMSGVMERVFQTLQDNIVAQFGWLYVLSVGFFLLFLVWLYLSRFGAVRLGKDADRPNYKNLTWFAMLFSAGMGIGLLFFSVSEPLLHFVNPPVGESGNVAAAKQAMNFTFLHWGFHAWAVYSVVGLSLAYFSYRHDLPLTIRSTLYPILGQRIHGWHGDTVDALAVIGTMFGLATSMGLGAMQINAGLDHLEIVALGVNAQLIIVGVVTLAATAAVVSGLDMGLRMLSQANMGLAVLLVAFVFVVGPSVFLISSLVQSVGDYFQELIALTFQTDAFRGPDWQKQWTMFYWGWWVSWSPFVGMFIARISRGRTIREFIGGVLMVPTAFTFIWLVVLGNTAIHHELFGDGGLASAAVENIPAALFLMLETLPFAFPVVIVTVLVIATFFITSAASGSMVMDQLTSVRAAVNPVGQRAFWAVSGGGVAAVLLLSGGLLALQTVAITMALPFCVIMLLMCRSLLKGLRAEEVRSPERTVSG